MKLDFIQTLGGLDLDQGKARLVEPEWRVAGETARLTDVLLCAPSYLEPVPCCAATRASLADGFQTDLAQAQAQHRALRRTLEALGVRCHVMPAAPEMPDLCFTRDSIVTTPWGPVVLNPAEAHRQREVDHAQAYLRSIGADPLLRITRGTIEGGDICVARDGLLIIGCSHERTSAAGADELAALFRDHGWDVVICPFDAEHLHLDTIFCMLDETRALACLDVLDAGFVSAMRSRGIELLAVSCAEQRALGCNILSIDGTTVLIGEDQRRLRGVLESAGFDPVPLPISQFSACGGGVHCLTMPLARAA